MRGIMCTLQCSPSYTMKVLNVCLAFDLCTFANGAKMPGMDHQRISDFDIRFQDVQNSLGNTIGMIQSMEKKLLQTEKHVGILGDKLKAYEKNNMLIAHLEERLRSSELTSKKYFIRVKMLENKLRKSEHDQTIQADILKRRLACLENRLSHVGELEMKLHEAESGLSKVDELENKLKSLEKNLEKIKQKSSGDDMEQTFALSEVKMQPSVQSKSYNVDYNYQWKESLASRKENERKNGNDKQETGAHSDRSRGLRAMTEGQVAFRASGIKRQDGYYPGERIIFTSLDYSEGSGFDMSRGTFVCPTSGTYFFAATIGSVNSNGVGVGLKVDGVVKMTLYACKLLQGDNMCSGVTIFHCQAGHSVWMEVTAGNHLGGWEAFSGFLLWSDRSSS